MNKAKVWVEGSNQCVIAYALRSDRGFVTRMISLWVFLHFCVGHRHKNQKLSSGKSSLERIFKKVKNS